MANETIITYNNSTIATLKAGQMATLKCKGDNVRMLTDIVVKAGSGGALESYDGKVTITKKVTLDPEFNHYGVIPEGCWLDYWDVNGDPHNYYEGDPFPSSYEDADHCEYFDNGLKYWYGEIGDGTIDEIVARNGWSFCEIEMGQETPEIQVLESIGGMSVLAITGLIWGLGGHDVITKLTIPKSIAYINLQFDSQMMPNGYPNLTSITYLGTKADWNNITFADDWNYDCPEITVTCTDGTITIPAYGS